MAEIAQTADHALRILEELGNGDPLSPGELAERLNLNRTVVHRLLATLSARGFVLRQGVLYRPGAALVRLADVLEPDLRKIAAPLMRKLSIDTGESAVLHIADGLEAVVLEQTVGMGHVLQVNHKIGSRHSLSTGASGRAMLAFLPETTIRQVLKKDENPAHLERSLAAVRQLGYALSHDELQTGVHGVATAVLGRDGFAQASLAVLVPVMRAQGIEDHVDALWKCASQISRSLDPESAGDPALT